jgi:predicted permease
MIPAYILIKTGKAEPAHAKTVSAILLYISFPAMIINSFQDIGKWYNMLLNHS